MLLFVLLAYFLLITRKFTQVLLFNTADPILRKPQFVICVYTKIYYFKQYYKNNGCTNL